MADPPQPTREPFPHSPEDFDGDDRISFSKISQKFILETEDGEEFEWEDVLKRWVPVVDDALLEEQRKAYKVDGVDEDEETTAGRKRKKNGDENHDSDPRKKKKPPKEPRERKNTAIYVQNLPADATAEEVQAVFSRCGVIAEAIDSGEPRIKLYTSPDDGSFKGDALIVYFRAESVALAVQLLDDTDFRLGQGVPAGRMKVAPADFSYKRQKDEGGDGVAGGGEQVEERGERKKEIDRKKIIRRTQKLNSKLADWDDDDPSVMDATSSRWDKVVILTHMFKLEELDEDPAAMLDIKEDIREECSRLGDVTNVVLYDKEPEGIVSVRFSTPEAARACIKVMHGRFFDGAQVEAFVATGKERFQKSGGKKELEEEEEEDRSEGEGPGGAEEVR